MIRLLSIIPISKNFILFKGRDIVGTITRYSTRHDITTSYWVCSDEIPTGVFCAVKCLASELNNPKIIITTDGKTTTAKMYKGDKVVNSTEAHCSSEDKFDFLTGAELAMKRLIEKEISVDGFKIGDRVNYQGINGTIICISDTNKLGVEFDERTSIFHNCGGVKLKAGKEGTKDTSRWLDSCELTHGELPPAVNGFKIGDRVHVNDKNGTIIAISVNERLGVEFDEPIPYSHRCEHFVKYGKPGKKGYCWWYDSTALNHGELPKYYNGKVVCVDSGIIPELLTVGRVYTFKDGNSKDDKGNVMTHRPAKDCDDLNSMFETAKFIPLVED